MLEECEKPTIDYAMPRRKAPEKIEDQGTAWGCLMQILISFGIVFAITIVLFVFLL